jgi:hypothetical protein
MPVQLTVRPGFAKKGNFEASRHVHTEVLGTQPISARISGIDSSRSRPHPAKYGDEKREGQKKTSTFKLFKNIKKYNSVQSPFPQQLLSDNYNNQSPWVM